MESPLGFMAVFAVSGSVVFIATQFHKRLLSDFMEKINSEFRSQKCMEMKKKVRFAADVVEPSGNSEEYRRRHSKCRFGNQNPMIDKGNNNNNNDIMPLNRLVLYKGILEYKNNHSNF